MASQEIVDSNQGFMQVSCIETALKVSEYIAKSSFCPKSFAGKPGDILVCLQMGQELGLKPMQAIQNIAVINGRPSLWGDAMLGVCRQSKDFEFIKETFDEATMTATCVVKRRNEPEFISSFSQKKAVTARLWGKEGPWTTYPERMLQMRARGFCLRDSFADLLRGIIIREEAEDMPRDKPDYSKVSGVIIEQDNSLIDSFQVSSLKEKIEEAGSKEIDLCNYLKIESLESMFVRDLNTINRMLNKKISDKKKTDLSINKILEGEIVESVEAKEFFDE